jgi:hypothetical protein
VTDETRLHKMMAEADDWSPPKVGDKVSFLTDGADEQVGVILAVEPDGGLRVVVSETGEVCDIGPSWLIQEDSAGPAAPSFKVGDRVRHNLGTTGTVMRVSADGTPHVTYDGDGDGPWPETAANLTVMPPAAAGTGGLAEMGALLARLDAATLTLTTHSQRLRDELEGQRRELWDELLSTARLAEIGGGPTSGHFLAGCKYFYSVATRTDGEELERLLNAELDSRYGTDRAKGGGPS